MSETIRLNKFISESGFCSRREADKFIENGLVLINGKKAKIGDQIHYGDKIKVNGQELEAPEKENLILIALNKPVGITSTTEENVKDNIVSFVNHSSRIFPIGRLDKDSQGLIFLTNNGDIVNKILRAGNKHEKEYIVTVDKPLQEIHLDKMAKGVPILGVMTKKCKIEKISTNVFKITLIQGLNRQIRRMCSHFDYEVVKLERIRIMNIDLKGLPLGDWRELNEKEILEIEKALENSNSDDLKKITSPKILSTPKKEVKKTNKSSTFKLSKQDILLEKKLKEDRNKNSAKNTKTNSTKSFKKKSPTKFKK